MGCISVRGTGCAARIWALAAGRIVALLAGPLLLMGNDAEDLNGAAGAHGASLTVSFSGLRSSRGLMRGCLTREARFFPDCDKDPHALRLSVPATPDARMVFASVPPGDYALSILHDENGNGRLDTMMGIPKEGVGFSENPVLRFSAPKFAAARFTIGERDMVKDVKLRYFL